MFIYFLIFRSLSDCERQKLRLILSHMDMNCHTIKDSRLHLFLQYGGNLMSLALLIRNVFIRCGNTNEMAAKGISIKLSHLLSLCDFIDCRMRVRVHVVHDHVGLRKTDIHVTFII